MQPTVTQQLESLKITMERVIMPALPPDQRFAQEQAGLIWATLGWLVDVHACEFGYELAEAADYRELLGALSELGAVEAALLDEQPAGADGDLAQVRSQSRRLKQAAVTAALAIGPAAQELLLKVADRQSARERAWFRMTGFTTTDAPGGITEVLATGSP